MNENNKKKDIEDKLQAIVDDRIELLTQNCSSDKMSNVNNVITRSIIDSSELTTTFSRNLTYLYIKAQKLFQKNNYDDALQIVWNIEKFISLFKIIVDDLTESNLKDLTNGLSLLDPNLITKITEDINAK